jgi:hypothetical protein
MTEQKNLQRNKLFAKGLERTATYAVRIGADIFKALYNFIREMISSAIGK